MRLFTGLGIGFMAPRLPPLLARPNPGSPGEAAGILDGDRVLSLDEEPVTSFAELVDSNSVAPGSACAQGLAGRPAISLDLYVGSAESDGRIVGRIGVPVAESALQAVRTVPRRTALRTGRSHRRVVPSDRRDVGPDGANAVADGDGRCFDQEHKRADRYRHVRGQYGKHRVGAVSELPGDYQYQPGDSQSFADPGAWTAGS